MSSNIVLLCFLVMVDVHTDNTGCTRTVSQGGCTDICGTLESEEIGIDDDNFSSTAPTRLVRVPSEECPSACFNYNCDDWASMYGQESVYACTWLAGLFECDCDGCACQSAIECTVNDNLSCAALNKVGFDSCSECTSDFCNYDFLLDDEDQLRWDP